MIGRLRSLGCGLLWAALIASLYLPMLWARFDFVDDGNLVYPAAPLPLAQRLHLTWEKIVANYTHLGPFRPVLWVHWDVQAEMLGADAPRWRLWRLTWTLLATATFLVLLRELHIGRVAALLTTALTMWSPAPNEIWRSLTLSEGVAMPYAIGALVCAVRGGRSRRAWPWDVAGAACVLAALGCKNTFAALVPAQLLLRVAPDGEALVPALRARGARAALLALPLLLPIAHFAVFLRGWHPGQYEPGLPSWRQLVRMIDRVQAGVSFGYMAPGLLAATALLVASGAPAATTGWNDWCRIAVAGGRDVWRRHRAAGRAGVALLLFGVGVYLPIPAAEGRYAIPAVWGAGLLIGALLSEAERLPRNPWRHAVVALLACGLVAVAVENLLRQDKTAARAAMLWDALEFVEQHAAPGAAVAWQSGADMNVGEGIHFYWHLRGRGHGDWSLEVLDADGAAQARPELPALARPPTLLLAAVGDAPRRGDWTVLQTFARSYHFGRRQHACVLWARAAP
jgi:hypothetical protein